VESESKAAGKGKGKQQPKGIQPVNINGDSFLSFKLLAPNTKVILGNRNTFRGQIIAKEIQVGEEGVLSEVVTLSLISDPEKIIESSSGPIFPVNEVLVDFMPDIRFLEARNIIDNVNGRIVGFIEVINMYQIKIPVTSEQELNLVIQTLESNTKVERAFPNILYSENILFD
jgi:hypothetical protein